MCIFIPKLLELLCLSLFGELLKKDVWWLFFYILKIYLCKFICQIRWLFKDTEGPSLANPSSSPLVPCLHFFLAEEQHHLLLAPPSTNNISSFHLGRPAVPSLSALFLAIINIAPALLERQPATSSAQLQQQNLILFGSGEQQLQR